jgi:outer membrane protein, heavy metal efflux system
MNKLIPYLILLLIYVSAPAQTTTPLDTAFMSLDQILANVEQAYPSIRQYDERIKAIEQRVAGATAWMAPMFSVSPSNFAYKPAMWKEESPMNQAGIMFSLTQNIPNPDRLKAQKNYFSSLINIERNTQQWTANALRTEAKLFYIQKLIATRKLYIIEESLELLKLIIKLAEDKYVYNQSDLSVIYKAKSRLGDLTNMQQMQLSIVQASNIGLNTLMNRDVTIQFKIDTAVSLKNYEGLSLSLADSMLYQNRNDIKAVVSTIRSMQKDQVARAAMRKPDFALGISHNQMLGMPKSWSIMGGVTIPIVPWVSKGWKSEIKMLDYEINSMQREKETMQLMARQMIFEKISMLTYEKKQYLAFGTVILPELNKNVETSMLQYRQATGNLFVLLDAWDMLLMKKIEQQDKLGILLQLEAQFEYEIEKR